MDQYVILETLKLKPPTPIHLIELTMGVWGRDLKFIAHAGTHQFELQFLDCRETRWQLYTHNQHDNNPPFPKTSLANFKQGRGQHRSPAHLLTDHFGLSVVYGSLQIIVDDTVHQLG